MPALPSATAVYPTPAQQQYGSGFREPAPPTGWEDPWGEQQHWERNEDPQRADPWDEAFVPERRWIGHQPEPHPQHPHSLKPAGGGFDGGSASTAESTHWQQQQNQLGWPSAPNAGGGVWGGGPESTPGHHASLPAVPHYAGGYGDYFRPAQPPHQQQRRPRGRRM